MYHKLDELAKGLPQSVTRRQALKKFGVGLTGIALACIGFTRKVEASQACLPSGSKCGSDRECCSGLCVPQSKALPFYPYRKVCA
jgi:hypothetical protein